MEVSLAAQNIMCVYHKYIYPACMQQLAQAFILHQKKLLPDAYSGDEISTVGADASNAPMARCNQTGSTQSSGCKFAGTACDPVAVNDDNEARFVIILNASSFVSQRIARARACDGVQSSNNAASAANEDKPVSG